MIELSTQKNTYFNKVILLNNNSKTMKTTSPFGNDEICIESSQGFPASVILDESRDDAIEKVTQDLTDDGEQSAGGSSRPEPSAADIREPLSQQAAEATLPDTPRLWELEASSQANQIQMVEIYKNNSTDQYTLSAFYYRMTSGEYHVTPWLSSELINNKNGTLYTYHIYDTIIIDGSADTIIHGIKDTFLFTRWDRKDTYFSELGGHSFYFTGGLGNNTFYAYLAHNHIDLTRGGDNTVYANGGINNITGGRGNDKIQITNDWNNAGHPGNWSSATVDLSLGGTNDVDIRGNTHTSGPTRAEITLGGGRDTIVAHDHTVVTILGANSTGNHDITLGGTAGHPGSVHTGQGHTTINWVVGNYVFEFGRGDLTMTVRGDVYQRFVFDGSGRTANDHLVLNNWREGGEIHTGEGSTTIKVNYGDYNITLGNGVNVVYLDQWIGTSLAVNFSSSGNDTVFAHNYGMELDLTGHSGEASLHLAQGNDRVIVDDPSAITPTLYNFDWNADRLIVGPGKDMFDFVDEGILAVRTILGSPNGYGYEFYNPMIYVFATGDPDNPIALLPENYVWVTIYSDDFLIL